MFQNETFDEKTIRKELGIAKSLGFNSMRVYLHDLLWEIKDEFLINFEKFLSICKASNIKPNSIKLMINNILCFKNGISLDNGSKTLEKSMRKNRIEIVVDLNNGKHKQTMYFCDLSHDYVRINSEYTT